MSLLSDREIREYEIITPFSEAKGGGVTYGVTSYGYDARLGEDIRIFTPVSPSGNVTIIDPSDFSLDCYVRVKVNTDENKRRFVILPPYSFALGVTVEHFNIPRNILAYCCGKSTYARCGIIIPVTPLEPEWRGYVTVEISNVTSLPVKVYVGEGIMQVNFFKNFPLCEVSYEDKRGRYQDQQGLTIPNTVEWDEL